jgi:hypothetical protein
MANYLKMAIFECQIASKRDLCQRDARVAVGVVTSQFVARGSRKGDS